MSESLPVDYDEHSAYWTGPPATSVRSESRGSTVVRVCAAIACGIAAIPLLPAIYLILASMLGAPHEFSGVGLVTGILGYVSLGTFCAAVLPFTLPKPWWTRGLVGSTHLFVGFSGLLIILGHYAEV